MERAVFESVRDQLDAILAPVKFRLAQEVYDHASFGSKLAIWTRRGGSIRLVFDGREELLSLETDVGGTWEMLFVGSPSDHKGVVAAAEQQFA